jgi:hypothetical protein
MIKIRAHGREASTTEQGAWTSEYSGMEKLLNEVAAVDKLTGYYPDEEYAMLEKAKEVYPDLEVIKITKKRKKRYQKGTIF